MFITSFNSLYSVYFYFMFYTYSILFNVCQGQSEINVYVFGRVKLSVDFLSYTSFAYFVIFVQELMLITDFCLAVFSTFANLVECLFYRNLLCNISCLGICLVLFDVHILTDSN